MLQELKKLARTMAKTISGMGYTGMNHRHCLDVIAKTGGMKNWQAVVALKDHAKPTPATQDEVLTCDEPGGTDFTMKPGVKSCWITVDGFAVHVIRTDEGVVVDILANRSSNIDGLASTYAYHSDAEADICESEGIELNDVAEWVGLHYKVNFDAASGPKRYEWILRYIKSHASNDYDELDEVTRSLLDDLPLPQTDMKVTWLAEEDDDVVDIFKLTAVVDGKEYPTAIGFSTQAGLDSSIPAIKAYYQARVAGQAKSFDGMSFEDQLDHFADVYKKGGIPAIEESAKAKGITGRMYCKPCEADMPSMHNTCLCCGTSASTDEGTSELRREALEQAGYTFHVSDFNRPYWSLGDEASDDFDSGELCVNDAWQDATRRTRKWGVTSEAWDSLPFDNKVTLLYRAFMKE